MSEKTLYIVAGCNGAGKTTASLRFLPSIYKCEHWVNADEIARGLSPFHPESVAIEAGRLMLERIQYHLTRGDTFAIETTLATRSYHRLVKQAQSLGYRVELVFFFLPSPEMAINRVRHRVKHGGHNIPKDVIVRRYYAGLRNLKDIYARIVDRWVIFRFDNGQYVMMDSGSDGKAIDIHINNDFEAQYIVIEEDKKYLTDEQQRLIECCNQAVLDMVKEMALHDDLVVWEDRNGNSIWVRARELLEKNPELKSREHVELTPVAIDPDRPIDEQYHPNPKYLSGTN